MLQQCPHFRCHRAGKYVIPNDALHHVSFQGPLLQQWCRDNLDGNKAVMGSAGAETGVLLQQCRKLLRSSSLGSSHRAQPL
eukprot:542518-Amphidinium_carterae.1